jgi:hypothetical protein
MKGWTGKNRDGNEYLPKLRTELQAILYGLYGEQDYYFGLQYGVLYNPELRDYVFKILFILEAEHNWVNGDILHQASEYGHLEEFVDALKGREVFMIGAYYFHRLPYQIIAIDDKDSYKQNDSLFSFINELKLSSETVFLVAAAMNSNIIIDKLPDSATAIDIGSVFDPYLGRPRASYQHKMKAEWLW